MTFSLIWAQKTHFRIGRLENNEKRLFYLVLRTFLPKKILLLGIEIPKID
jgi:hypothetical protein